ncbi:50S ribosomal protein L3 [Candidatus Peribacteria bacterium RIFOXYC2_FULL_55_14]|nr:MAG: 50S ribosomal protein L3 [Candidatus Peribacteria bacterium GW2011_GWC2_54_8]KKW43892.1 MAG: 50S ribosomal protein L3 [Candidatus Peregrinibacteria bacterium GW2011_GWA2_54_9]OGJ71744.1 MAG: 50S ribosomal protein L3 [Candidatus Peribacteria bacterium RIFOXYA1_FULL_56_14]OGJ73355.1 MAG: 50S ribosomal protein L3 [Candidatus Peribacteria bacterium RIFOXYA2_FULL_55_28]OGJ74537.1 MAG: 50S ribosomal protein L3 [Candidatus Peribacteria bacterium RIFOXYB1_FULL_54_35]OGJ77583.1 MAG: 50S ribosom
MSGIIAKKVGMSRIFLEDGEAVAVTYLQVQPNTIVRTKTEGKDGYNAVVLGIEPKKWRTRKGKEHVRYRAQKEWRMESLEGMEPGKALTADTVQERSIVTVCALSKGKGFQGVMRRYNFQGGPATHGSHIHRRPGSVGMREKPGRIMKGKRMPGHMGGGTVTLRGRPVLVCDREKGIIGVKGPIPGPNGGLVYVTVESLPSAGS